MKLRTSCFIAALFLGMTAPLSGEAQFLKNLFGREDKMRPVKRKPASAKPKAPAAKEPVGVEEKKTTD